MSVSRFFKYFGLIAGSLAIFVLAQSRLFVEAQVLPGGSNVLGWAWAGNTDNFLSPTPLIQGGELQNGTGLGWISLSSVNTNSSPSYGLTMPLVDGNVTGYGWSSGLGWINFQPTGPYPSAPNHGVQRVSDVLDGWARVENIPAAGANAGGYDGWIRFSSSYVGSIAGTSYTGVQIIPQGSSAAPVTDIIRGFAWSNDFGWIIFGATGNPRITTTGPQSITPVSCSASQSNVTQASPATSITISASGGTTPGAYAWSGDLGSITPSPTAGTQSFQTSYSGLGVHVITVANGTTATCSVTVNVPAPPPPPPTGSLQCLPAIQTALRNQQVTLTAQGGNSGTYHWTTSGSGANPVSGDGASFMTRFSTSGTKLINLTRGSGSESATCRVTVIQLVEENP